MEHPNYEELFMHLEGSSSADAARRMEEHLENCPQCAAELAGWQRSIKRLQECVWPERRAASRSAWSLMALKWAAAAALVLGLGFGLGRAFPPGTARLRDSIYTEARQQLRREIRADLLAGAAVGAPAPRDGFQQTLRREFELAMAASGNKTANENRRLLQEAIQAIEQKQEDNQRAVMQALARLEEQHAADYLSLRQDLETAVSVADSDLKQKSRLLTELTTTVLARTGAN
jgi:anti-sigma factor RsiW